MEIPAFKIELPLSMRKQMVENVADVAKSGMFATGKYVAACQNKMRELVGTDALFMTSSGSSALEAAAQVMMLRHNFKGETVLIPNNTFAATSLAFERAGFKVKFYDNRIDKVAHDKGKLLELMEDAHGLVVVDLGGFIPEDIEDWVKEAHKRGMWVVEDACQAFGSASNDKMAGTYGDIGTYSFFSTKVYSSGEGGAVLTNNPAIAQELGLYIDFGKPEKWVSYHVMKGWNCRMSEFGAAVLLPQLEAFWEIVANREAILNTYTGILQDKVEMIPLGNGDRFNGYKVVVYLPEGVKRCDVKDYLKDRNVNLPGNVYDTVLSQQPIYSNMQYEENKEWHDKHRRMICLPTYFGMTQDAVAYVALTLLKAIKVFGGK